MLLTTAKRLNVSRSGLLQGAVVRMPERMLFSSTGNSMSDRDLQLKQNSLWHEIRCWLNLFDPMQRGKFIALKQKGVLPDKFMRSLVVYNDLQNPLLERYDISEGEIIEGAKYAYETVNRVSSSKEYYDSFNGKSAESESHQLLRSVFCPEIYQSWIEFQDPFRASFTTVNFKKAFIRDVYTEVVPGDVPLSTSMMTDADRKKMLERVDPDSIKVMDKKVEDMFGDLSPYTKDFTKMYPKGSVAAMVTVEFVTSETSALSMPALTVVEAAVETSDTNAIDNANADANNKVTEQLETTTRNVAWTFAGCISGQVPLDWVVVDINEARGQGYNLAGVRYSELND